MKDEERPGRLRRPASSSWLSFILFLSDRLASFRYAFAGWAAVLRTQPNARIHAALTAAAFGLAAWLRPARAEWALLALTVGLVWVAECVNTAVEAAADLASPGRHPLAHNI